MLTTRFSKSGGISTCFRKPPITTYFTPAARHGSKIARLKSASLVDFFFSTTSVGIAASRAYSNPRAAGLLEITSRIFTGSEPAAILSIRLRSVVPPPEMRTAMGSGGPDISHTEAQRHREEGRGTYEVSARQRHSPPCLCASV